MTNTHTARTLSILAAAGTLSFAAFTGTAIGHAEPLVTHGYWVDPRTGDAYQDVILLSEVPQIDRLPACRVEDCSYVPEALQPAVWTNHAGDAYVMWTDGPTFLVIDDTALR